MNVLEYVANVSYGDDFICREEFSKRIYKMVGYKGSDEELLNIRKVELLSLIFGPISTREIKMMDWPQLPDENACARLLSRECFAGRFDRFHLPNYDGDVRHIYTLTKAGKKDLGLLIKSRLVKKHPVRTLRHHDYVLGYSLFLLFIRGFDISFKFERLVNSTNDDSINYKDALRADALLTLNGKKYYVEQDMNTEPVNVLRDKLVKYDASEIPVILSFHTALTIPKCCYSDMCKAADSSIKYESLSEKHQKLRDVYLALSDKKDYTDALDVLSKNSKLALRCINHKSLYELTLSKIKTLFKYIINDDSLLDACTNRMEVYAIASELIYTCSAFISKGTDKFYFEKLRNLYSDTFVYGQGVYAYGVRFNECMKYSDHTVYVLFPEDNLSDLLRIYATASKIKSSCDRYVILYHTEAFLELMRSIITDKEIFFSKMDYVSF